MPLRRDERQGRRDAATTESRRCRTRGGEARAGREADAEAEHRRRPCQCHGDASSLGDQTTRMGPKGVPPRAIMRAVVLIRACR